MKSDGVTARHMSQANLMEWRRDTELRWHGATVIRVCMVIGLGWGNNDCLSVSGGGNKSTMSSVFGGIIVSHSDLGTSWQGGRPGGDVSGVGQEGGVLAMRQSSWK